MDKKINLKTQGFSLIEVMIALAIFGVFIVSFISGQIFNVTQSDRIRSDLALSEIAKYKMNEILIDPPQLKETLTSQSTSKLEDYPDYEYQITIKKIYLPNYSKLTGKNNNQNDDASTNAIEAKIFDQLKVNLEKLIWQLKLTIIRKTTGEKYSLSTWLYNHKNDQVIFQGL